MIMISKHPLSSKTIWFNILTLVAGFLVLAQGQDFVADNPTASTFILIAIAAVNFALRFVTKVPVTLVKE